MKRISLAASLVFMFIFILMSFAVQAQITDDTFQQAVKEYQAAPTFDNAKKVVKLSAVMRKLPSIPEEARKHFVRGRALFEDAKSPGDFTQATEEFLQATRLAPWWPEARYNTALAFEAAKNYANAIVNLKIYQLFKLSTNEAQTVQDKIWELEMKQEKTAKASAEEANIQKLAGIWKSSDGYYQYTVTINGQTIEIVNSAGWINNSWQVMGHNCFWRGTVTGVTITGKWIVDWNMYRNGIKAERDMSGTVSENGDRIHIDYKRVDPNGSDVNNMALGWRESIQQLDLVR